MKFAAKDVTVTYGGTDVTAHIQGDFEVNATDETQDSKSFGERFNESLKTGDTMIADITWSGLYDDDANAPKLLWDVTSSTPSPSTAAVDLVITYGTPSGSPADAITIPVLVKNFTPKLSRNKIHEYSVTFTKGPGSITRT